MKIVKNNIVSVFIGVLLLALGSCQKETIDTLRNTGTTQEKSIDLKMGFTAEKKTLETKQLDAKPSLLARYNHRSLVFDGKMWIMGGILINEGNDDYYTYDSDDVLSTSDNVLFSTDGTHWKNSTEKGDFPKRSLFGATVFKNKMWVAGGLKEFETKPIAKLNNDVWSSENGTEWKLVTPKAQFPKRFENSLTAFNGSLWLIGGVGLNEKTNTYKTLSDIWRSPDGHSWIKVTDNAPFGPRRWHTAIVHDNKIWVVGGGNSTYQSDVWYSENGYQWIQATDNAPFSTRGLHAMASDGKSMWLTAGHMAQYGDENSFNHQNDIWYSANGEDWYEAGTSQEFPKRTQHSSVFFNGKLWVINGVAPSYGSGTSPILSDVWSFEDASYANNKTKSIGSAQ